MWENSTAEADSVLEDNISFASFFVVNLFFFFSLLFFFALLSKAEKLVFTVVFVFETGRG